MKSPLRKLMRLLLLHMAVRQKRLVLQLIRIKAALYCVKGVKAARGAFLAYLGLKCVLGLLAFGMALAHIGFFLYVPWSMKARALTMLALGGVYIFAAVGILVFFTREKWWMKQTGVSEIVAEAMQSNRRRRYR